MSLTLTQGDFALLTGDNGAGKTTLLRIIAGLDKPDDFRVDTDQGLLTWQRYRQLFREQVFYLHQQAYLFSGTVQHNLDYALPRSLSSAQRQNRVDAALQWAQLESLALHDAKKVSGGEAQRIALTRAWLRAPQFLLLDEPTVNMDAESRVRTTELLGSLQAQGVALLISTHDPNHFPHTTKQWHLAQGGMTQVVS